VEQGANSRNKKSRSARGVGPGSQPVVRWKAVPRGKCPSRGASIIRCIADPTFDLSTMILLNREPRFLLTSDMRTPETQNFDVPFEV
jgi:hypothetical protein